MTNASSDSISRRDFVKTSAKAVGAAALASLAPPILAYSGEAAPSSKVVGIQIGAVSFVDEGTDQVLDLLQEKGAVNTLFLTTFTYGRGLAGRQIPGQPF